MFLSKAMYKFLFLLGIIGVFSVSTQEVDYVSYDKTHMEIVKAGMPQIKEYYFGGSISEKRSLILCLDRFLDPHYQYQLSYEEYIFDWLEDELKGAKSLPLKEDIFDLLYNYSERGYEDCELLDSGEIKCGGTSN
tara:strand:- start:343 stop:747 length:405 start_codon:yes stop_codon:yes gene_type:complete